MKTLELKQTELKINQDGNASYKDLILLCVNAPKQGGFTITEIKSRLEIVDAVEKADGSLQLENSAAQLLQEIVSEFKWGSVHADIVQFVEDVQNMKELSS